MPRAKLAETPAHRREPRRRQILVRTSDLRGVPPPLALLLHLLGVDRTEPGRLRLPPGLEPEVRRRHDARQQREHEPRAQDGHPLVPPAPAPDPLDPADRPGEDRLTGKEPPEVVGKGRRARVTPGRVLLEALQTDGLQVPAHRAVELSGRDGVLVQDLPQGLDRGGGLERRTTGDQAVEQRTQRIQIGRRTHLFGPAGGLLRRHEARSPDDLAGMRQVAQPAGPLGQAEIADLRVSIPVQQDIAGLQVPVDDPLLVRVRHGDGHVQHQLGRPPARQRAVLDPAREAPPLDVAHREERLALVLPDLEDGHDSVMVELGGRLGLLAEPPELLVRCQGAGQDHLQRDRAPQALLPRQVHHTHTAAGDLLDHLVIAERSGRHRVGRPGPDGQCAYQVEGAGLLQPRLDDRARAERDLGLDGHRQGRVQVRSVGPEGRFGGSDGPESIRRSGSSPATASPISRRGPAAHIDGPSPPEWRRDDPRRPMVRGWSRSIPRDQASPPRALNGLGRPDDREGAGSLEFAADQGVQMHSLWRPLHEQPTPDWQSVVFLAVPAQVPDRQVH